MYNARRWMLYAEHRRLVEETIAAARSETDKSITLVGAGRCYDADLRALSAWFDRIALVDIDEDAVREGLAAQGAAAEVVAPFDVTRTGKLPGQPFDGIVSQCLLSQLIKPHVAVLEGDELIAAVQATRAAHLRFLLDSIKPGGWAILVWDIVTSETLPEILNGAWTRRSVAKIAERAVAGRNYLTGLAPQLVIWSLENDPWLKEACAYHLDRPWVWTDDPGHARIVYALTLRRA